MHEVDYRALVNPTFQTAQQTLYLLAAARNEDAICYIQQMGLKNGLEHSRKDSQQENPIFTQQEAKDLMLGVTLGVECRYETLTRLIRESGLPNVFDIACGYTPRALTAQKMGLHYVGLDVPVVAEQMSQLAEKVFPEADHPIYVGGDATNAASLAAATDSLDGPLFITSEGLLQYLSKNELIQMIQGIRQILKKHGGAWYSSDMEVAYDALSAAAIGNPDALRRFAQARSALANKTDIYFESASFENLEEKLRFFESHGLQVTRMPFYLEGQNLNTLATFPTEKQEKLKGLLKSFCIWKMNLAADRGSSDAEPNLQKAENLSISYFVEDGLLHCTPAGRIDTLSAPALLKLFEETEMSLTGILLDCGKLEYISSAGLRILMMAVKRLGEGSVCLTHANAMVREILETTGFDTILRICD